MSLLCMWAYEHEKVMMGELVPNEPSVYLSDRSLADM